MLVVRFLASANQKKMSYTNANSQNAAASSSSMPFPTRINPYAISDANDYSIQVSDSGVVMHLQVNSNSKTEKYAKNLIVNTIIFKERKRNGLVLNDSGLAVWFNEQYALLKQKMEEWEKEYPDEYKKLKKIPMHKWRSRVDSQMDKKSINMNTVEFSKNNPTKFRKIMNFDLEEDLIVCAKDFERRFEVVGVLQNIDRNRFALPLLNLIVDQSAQVVSRWPHPALKNIGTRCFLVVSGNCNPDQKNIGRLEITPQAVINMDNLSPATAMGADCLGYQDPGVPIKILTVVDDNLKPTNYDLKKFYDKDLSISYSMNSHTNTQVRGRIQLVKGAFS